MGRHALSGRARIQPASLSALVPRARRASAGVAHRLRGPARGFGFPDGPPGDFVVGLPSSCIVCRAPRDHPLGRGPEAPSRVGTGLSVGHVLAPGRRCACSGVGDCAIGSRMGETLRRPRARRPRVARLGTPARRQEPLSRGRQETAFTAAHGRARIPIARSVYEVRAVPGRGLEGDRYFGSRLSFGEGESRWA